jgi:hypothetical protein
MDDELRDKLKSTSGGSRDTELKELTVIPTGACPERDAVITATPVGKRPSVARKEDELKLGLDAVILGRETSECPANAGLLIGEAIV